MLAVRSMTPRPIGGQRRKAAGENEDLRRRVDACTYRQIRNLSINLRGELVTITGSSNSYYIKQLATGAILSAMPAVSLQNEILVSYGIV